MYCKNCGVQMSDTDEICKSCNTKKGFGSSYCKKCGKETPAGAVFCPECSSPLNSKSEENTDVEYKPKSRKTAGLLGIFLGGLGIHNFYLGNIGVGAAQLLIVIATCGAGFVITEIWGIIEGVRLLTGAVGHDGKGFPLKD